MSVKLALLTCVGEAYVTHLCPSIVRYSLVPMKLELLTVVFLSSFLYTLLFEIADCDKVGNKGARHSSHVKWDQYETHIYDIIIYIKYDKIIGAH